MTVHTPEEEQTVFDEEALGKPVPNMDELRKRKVGYNELPIDTENPKFHEPVVDISSYGIAGQSYYSRSNPATGQAVPNIPTTLFLRQSVAETLAKINGALDNPAVTQFFGGEVELYVEDALRPVELQTRLYDEVIPELIRRTNPEMNDEEVLARRKDIIALPSSDPEKPSPHATGGVMDVSLRFKQPTSMFVEGSGVPMGHTDGSTSDRINPDYFEQHPPENDEDELARRNRRAYYAIMTGSAFVIDTGFVNNPTEWWHWGIGDQLSAKIRGDASAYYSLATPPQQ